MRMASFVLSDPLVCPWNVETTPDDTVDGVLEGAQRIRGLRRTGLRAQLVPCWPLGPRGLSRLGKGSGLDPEGKQGRGEERQQCNSESGPCRQVAADPGH